MVAVCGVDRAAGGRPSALGDARGLGTWRALLGAAGAAAGDGGRRCARPMALAIAIGLGSVRFAARASGARDQRRARAVARRLDLPAGASAVPPAVHGAAL